MKIVAGIAMIVAAIALGSARPAAAHHSHSMFDMTKEIALTGTVASVSYRNPHVFLNIDVKRDTGEVVS